MSPFNRLRSAIPASLAGLTFAWSPEWLATLPEWLRMVLAAIAVIVSLVLAWLDTNHDGKVSLDEVRAAPGRIRARSPWWVAGLALIVVMLTACGGQRYVTADDPGVTATIAADGAFTLGCGDRYDPPAGEAVNPVGDDLGCWYTDGAAGTAELRGGITPCFGWPPGTSPSFCIPLDVHAQVYAGTDDGAGGLLCIDSPMLPQAVCAEWAPDGR